jgi:uncharacterized protein YcfJ
MSAELALLGMAVVTVTWADERLFVYPAAGQSPAQLADDRYACHERAVQASGFDPTHAALTTAAAPARAVVKVPPNPSEGATAKGTLAGAVAGGVVGANSGGHHDHGESTAAGIAVGAAVGALIGNSIERQGAQSAEAQARAQGEQQIRTQDERAAELERQRVQYRDAFTGCMQARGYTVR